MVATVLRGANVGLPVTLVHASDGKSARAEPVGVLFESGKAKFAGRFPELEDALAGLTYGGGYEGPGRSPGRAGAMVWAMTELLVNRRVDPRVRSFRSGGRPGISSLRWNDGGWDWDGHQ